MCVYVPKIMNPMILSFIHLFLSQESNSRPPTCQAGAVLLRYNLGPKLFVKCIIPYATFSSTLYFHFAPYRPHQSFDCCLALWHMTTSALNSPFLNWWLVRQCPLFSHNTGQHREHPSWCCCAQVLWAAAEATCSIAHVGRHTALGRQEQEFLLVDFGGRSTLLGI